MPTEPEPLPARNHTSRAWPEHPHFVIVTKWFVDGRVKPREGG